MERGGGEEEEDAASVYEGKSEQEDAASAYEGKSEQRRKRLRLCFLNVSMSDGSRED